MPTLYLGAVVGEVRACTYGWTMCRGEERMLTRAPDVVLGTLLREKLLNNNVRGGNCCRCRRPVGPRAARNSAARCTIVELDDATGVEAKNCGIRGLHCPSGRRHHHRRVIAGPYVGEDGTTDRAVGPDP